jgi:hypothetical protein
MMTPVEQGNFEVFKPASGKRGTTSFTRAAVQRAMDERAARWGAPEGYYTVEDRSRIMRQHHRQVWLVRVRLFGGSIHHVEEVVFGKFGGKSNGHVEYVSTYEHWIRQGGKAVKQFPDNTARYPSMAEAKQRWEGKV